MIGAVTSYIAILRDLKSRRAEARAGLLRDEANTQRRVSAVFLAKVDMVNDRSREVARWDRPEDVPEQIRGEYEAAWKDYFGENATLAVYASEPVANAAMKLYVPLAANCNQVDRWLAGGDEWLLDDFDARRQEIAECRSEFLSALRASIPDATKPLDN